MYLFFSVYLPIVIYRPVFASLYYTVLFLMFFLCSFLLSLLPSFILFFLSLLLLLVHLWRLLMSSSLDLCVYHYLPICIYSSVSIFVCLFVYLSVYLHVNIKRQNKVVAPSLCLINSCMCSYRRRDMHGLTRFIGSEHGVERKDSAGNSVQSTSVLSPLIRGDDMRTVRQQTAYNTLPSICIFHLVFNP